MNGTEFSWIIQDLQGKIELVIEEYVAEYFQDFKILDDDKIVIKVDNKYGISW